MSLESAYDRGTFEWYKEFKDDYFAIADALVGHIAGSAIDIGCGAGYILERVERTVSCPIKAVEGSSGCIQVMSQSVREALTILDVSSPFYLCQKYALVICLEVGEHLAPESADVLVNNIFNHSLPGGLVYFSAATPGQGGHLHLNEQPHEYWISKFHARGISVDGDRTLHMSGVAGNTRLSWLRDNGIVFNVSSAV